MRIHLYVTSKRIPNVSNLFIINKLFKYFWFLGTFYRDKNLPINTNSQIIIVFLIKMVLKSKINCYRLQFIIVQLYTLYSKLAESAVSTCDSCSFKTSIVLVVY